MVKIRACAKQKALRKSMGLRISAIICGKIVAPP